ncbi:MAG: hypothetical protein IT336_14175 [Thermomicrobiales bacterium]|nr:hypothetical protein [Thermomicrobiales bacterium]
MIDLHLHLLPAVDDGAASIDVSTEMLRRAESFGFTSLIATPHLDGPLTSSYEGTVRHALSEVRAAGAEIPVSIELGYEIQLSPDLPARLHRGERSRLADSTTVLVELPFAGWPLFAEQTLFDLQTMGLRPLLAHPERYAAVQAEPEKALDLVDRGVLLQVTLGSLVGLFGKHAQKTAELLVREGATTVLASDAHSAGQRFVAVGDGLKRAEELVGAELVRQLVYDNPKALLESRPLPSPVDIVTNEAGERGWRKLFQRGGAKSRV